MMADRQMDSTDLRNVALLLEGINKAMNESGLEIDPTCGLVSSGAGRVFGYLRWDAGGVVLDSSA